MKKQFNKMVVRLAAATLGLMMLSSCGGGGSGRVLYYPYETLFGDLCSSSEPVPGCTFHSDDGSRIKVTEDPDYGVFGNGSDDMWYVEFWKDSDGNVWGDVSNNLGLYQNTLHISEFAGWVGDSYIGLGTTGLFWENVTNGVYWWGKNGVLYSGNPFDSNFGEAINNDIAFQPGDMNFAALSSEGFKELNNKAAKKLVDKYGFSDEKAHAVANALSRWNVSAVERGFTTTKAMDKTFQETFGVDFNSALSAVKSYMAGNKEQARDLTNRSAAALGIKPHHAEQFIKDMYADALADYNYDVSTLKW